MKSFQFAIAVAIAFVGSSFTLSNVHPNTETLAGFDYFLEIEGVKGESRHGGKIEVLSWSWGESNASIHITRSRTPTVSPAIQRLAAQGKPVRQVILYVKEPGSTEYLKYKMKDVLISSYQTSGTSSQPMESFSLNFTKVE